MLSPFLALAALLHSTAALADTCEDAADRYETCVGELLGPQAASMVHDKRAEGIPACRKDPKTVAMYERCLPEPICAAFLGCLEQVAAESAPPAAPTPEPDALPNVTRGVTEPVPVDRGKDAPAIQAVSPFNGAVRQGLWDLPGADLLLVSDDGLVLAHGGGRIQGRETSGAVRFSVQATGEFRALAVSPDGQRVAILDDGLRLLDGAGKTLHTLKASPTATDVALSPTGALLAMGDDDGLHLIDTATGKRLRTLTSEWSPDAVFFHPDGAVLYSSDPFQHNVFDVATGAQLTQFGGGFSTSFALNPDRTVLWTMADDSDPPKRWNAKTYERLERFPSTDLIYVAVPSADTQTWIIDGGIQRLDQTEPVPFTEADVIDAAWLPDGRGVLFATEAGIESWRLVGDERITALGGLRTRAIPAPEPGWVVSHLAWTEDGTAVAEAWDDGVVQVWNVATGTQRWAGQIPGCELDDEGYPFCPVDDLGIAGGALTVSLWPGRQARFSATKGGKPRVKQLGEVQSMTWTAAGPVVHKEDTIALPNGKRITLEGANEIAATPTAHRVVVIDYDDVLHVFDGGGKRLAKHPLGEGWIDELALSPDGSRIALSRGEERLEIRDTDSGKVVYARDGGWVDAVAFSPDGKTLAVGGVGLSLLDTTTGAVREQLAFAGQYGVGAIAWSPDGSRLAVAQTWESGDRVWWVQIGAAAPDRAEGPPPE